MAQSAYLGARTCLLWDRITKIEKGVRFNLQITPKRRRNRQIPAEKGEVQYLGNGASYSYGYYRTLLGYHTNPAYWSRDHCDHVTYLGHIEVTKGHAAENDHSTCNIR